jgi:hypothetical protein
VTWQDELRRLDEDLAAGRLSAEDYRRQRDELLSQGASAPGMRRVPRTSGLGQSGGPAGSTPPAPEPPGPPAPRPAGPPGGPPSPGPPQQPLLPPPAAAPTGGPFPAAPTGGPFPAPPSRWDQEPLDATQVINPIRDDQRPPWSRVDLRPPDQAQPWYQQGPESEDTDGGSRAIRIMTAVGVVLLLIGISASAYYVFRPENKPSGAPPSSQATPSAGAQASTQPVTPSRQAGPPIAGLPGTATDTSRVKTFVDVEAIGYLTNQEIDAYRATGAAASKLAISNSGNSRIIVLVTQQADPAGAARTRDALGDLQLRFKLTALSAAPGVLSAGIDNADPGPLRRAHYAAGNYVVRIQVQGIDRGEVDRLYSEVLGIQLDELPANA